jgi:hypothetical protein
MARGWESKSVEGQMEEAGATEPVEVKRPLTDEEKKTERERESLRLSRTYVLSKIESSTNERYLESLRRALSEIEKKLAQIGKDSR